MHRKVLLLSSSFERAKGTGVELAAAATRGALIDDPHAPVGAEQRTARWKVRSAYGDIGLQYRADETVAYVASRMPAIYAACHRVLREVQEPPCPVCCCSYVPSELNFACWDVLVD
jgi:5-oxoprolinase (ATP-hydrolysing)